MVLVTTATTNNNQLLNVLQSVFVWTLFLLLVISLIEFRSIINIIHMRLLLFVLIFVLLLLLHCHNHHHHPYCYNHRILLLIIIVIIIIFVSNGASFDLSMVMVSASKSNPSQRPLPMESFVANDNDDRDHNPHRLSTEVIKIKYGLLRGLLVDLEKITTGQKSTSAPVKLQPIKAYLGVPYASPPTGALRFMPPVTPAHWNGIRNVDQLQPLCPQRLPSLASMTQSEALKHISQSRFDWLKRMVPRLKNQSEDCLYLNIYSPFISPEDKQSIEFEAESALNDETYAADDDDDDDDDDEYPDYGNMATIGDQTWITPTTIKHRKRRKRHLENQPKVWTTLGKQPTISLDTINHTFPSFLPVVNHRLHHHHQRRQHLYRWWYSTLMTPNDFSTKLSKRKTRGVVMQGTGSGSGGGKDKSFLIDSKSSGGGGGGGDDDAIAKTFPVLVFITSESYEWNSGSLFDGSILASFGQVIVVTLNFRLGILGFMPANIDGTVRGNYGLMDQVAALHWIQENIAQFGGQPNNITLVGHGFGSACAHLLMLSPMAKGLFNRVILMSGSALAPWAIARDSLMYAKQVTRQVGCPVDETLMDGAFQIDCLRMKSVTELQSTQYQVPDHLTGFGPIIDGIVIPQEPRILLHHIRQNIWQRQQQQQQPHYHSHYHSSSASQFHTTPPSWSTISAHIHRTNHNYNNDSQTPNKPVTSAQHLSLPNPDLMVGVTENETPWFILGDREQREGITVQRRNRLLRTLVRNLYDYHQQAIYYTLINEYTDWTRPLDQPLLLLDSLKELLGDGLVVAPSVESLDHHFVQSITTNLAPPSSSSSSAPNSFFYVLTNQNQENQSTKGFRFKHGDDLALIFGVPFLMDRFLKPTYRKNHLVGYPTLDVSPIDHWMAEDIQEEDVSGVPNSANDFNRTKRIMEMINLCQTIIGSWNNFAVQGDPNPTTPTTLATSRQSPESTIPTTATTTATTNTNSKLIHSSRHHQHRLQQQRQQYEDGQLDEDQWNGMQPPPPSPFLVPKATATSHDRWLSRFGYQTITNTPTIGMDTDGGGGGGDGRLTFFWPPYDTTKRPYLQFGSSTIEPNNHYHSHRLSIWLSLIPRLHAPIELRESTNDGDGGYHRKIDDVTDHQLQLDAEQHFYLKHHLLPDHENSDTYDGQVKPLSIKIPDSKQWQHRNLRRNMTSLLEQHQQLVLYGRLYQTNPEGGTPVDHRPNALAPSSLSHLSSLNNETTIVELYSNTSHVQEQYARRQIESKNRAKSSNIINQKNNSNSKSNHNNNNNQKDQNNNYNSESKTVKHLANMTSAILMNSSTSNNSSSSSSSSSMHYESTQMTAETYSTLVWISFLIGGTLFILNLIIVVGVYFQMKNTTNTNNTMSSEMGVIKYDLELQQLEQQEEDQEQEQEQEQQQQNKVQPKAQANEETSMMIGSLVQPLKSKMNGNEWCCNEAAVALYEHTNQNLGLMSHPTITTTNSRSRIKEKGKRHLKDDNHNYHYACDKVASSSQSIINNNINTDHHHYTASYHQNDQIDPTILMDQNTMMMMMMINDGHRWSRSNNDPNHLRAAPHSSSSEQSTPLKSILKKGPVPGITKDPGMLPGMLSLDGNIGDGGGGGGGGGSYLIPSSDYLIHATPPTAPAPASASAMVQPLYHSEHQQQQQHEHHENQSGSLQLIYGALDLTKTVQSNNGSKQQQQQSLINDQASMDPNFISFISEETSRDLSQLPYITLTEMYQQQQQQQQQIQEK